MALESCKTLALFGYRFLCVKSGKLRSDGWQWYRNLSETLELEVDSDVNDKNTPFSCDLMPINLVKFNTETEN